VPPSQLERTLHPDTLGLHTWIRSSKVASVGFSGHLVGFEGDREETSLPSSFVLPVPPKGSCHGRCG
jgi:hypothetical protein